MSSVLLWTETFAIFILFKKVKCSRYRPGVAQRVGRGIALLFHDRGTRRRWVVSSTLRPHFTPGKDPVPILQEAGWATGPVWTDGKSRPHRDSIPDRPAHSQSLYRLSCPAHIFVTGSNKLKNTELGLLGIAWCWYQVFFFLNSLRSYCINLENRAPKLTNTYKCVKAS